jgi:hypothetical protein
MDALFVIFTAYFDESDTHGPEPTVIMGGFLGHAYQWRAFNRDLDRIRAEFGFRVFHAKEFKHKSGDFSGWDDEKCRRLLDCLANLVHRRLTEGVTVDLPRKRYLNEYRASSFPAKMQPDSQYGLCFRVCLGHFLQVIGARGGKRPILHIVIEAGHKNVGDTQRVFNELRKWMARQRSYVLGTMKIAQKCESNELMVADFLAHTYSMMRASNPLLLQQLPDQSEPSDRPKGEASLTYLEFRNETFQEFKDIFASERQAAMDDWWARRTVKGARTCSAGASAG